MTRSSTQNKTSEKVIAGATGAGSGTLIVLLAKNLPEISPWKSWLLIIAPSISVLAGGLYHWGKDKIVEHFQQKDFTAAIEQARQTLEKALKNPATTDEHKKVLQANLEKLERLESDAKMKKVEMLANA